MEEIWKDVVGYNGLYQVSNLGNIKNRDGRILKQQTRNHGYLSVWLYGGAHLDGRNGKAFSVHRIVAEAFLPNPNGCAEVNHKDENKKNNAVENLEWCSHKENSNHGTRGKRIGAANKNGKQSRAVFQFSADGKLLAVYPSMAEVQRSTGFRKGNIWKQMSGKYELAYGYKWSH